MNGPAGGAQTIPRALAYWARRTPDGVALLSPGRSPVSYRDLHLAVTRVASALRAVGLGREDGIAVVPSAGVDLCVALLAATSVGIAMPMSLPAAADTDQGILEHGIVRAVLTSELAAPARVPAGREVPIVMLAGGTLGTVNGIDRDGQAAARVRPERLPVAADLALILSTSGTTGRRKLVPRTHRAVVSTARAVIATRAKTRADRCLNLASMVHSQGFNALIYTLFTGASLVLPPVSRPDFEELPGWLASFRPTYISTTPAVLQALASDRGGFVEAVRRSTLRFIHSTAGTLAAEQQSQLETQFGVPILNGYGMSEAPGIAAEPYPLSRRVPGSVGPPMCDIRFLDEEGRPVADRQIGEIVVRGPRVFPGYLGDPDATAAAFLPGGWFRTGDLGYQDANGMVHLAGRLNERINRGGEKIALRGIDDALLAHPAVADAAVFGVPHARLGEDIVAAIVPTSGAAPTPRQVRAWLLDRLPPYWVPRRIWLVDQIPRTPNGKAQRQELARRWGERQG